MWFRIFHFYVILIEHQMNSYVCMPFLWHIKNSRYLNQRTQNDELNMGEGGAYEGVFVVQPS